MRSNPDEEWKNIDQLILEFQQKFPEIWREFTKETKKRKTQAKNKYNDAGQKFQFRVPATFPTDYEGRDLLSFFLKIKPDLLEDKVWYRFLRRYPCFALAEVF